jgi:mannitol/fructose-specific phosphotransferase system IIA component (Ntr-type)
MKQETLKEATERILNNNSISDADMILSDTILKVVKSMVEMAKWQQERICDSEFLQKLRATKSDAEARRLIKTI